MRESKVFVLEDHETARRADGLGLGFLDCELPCIQKGCQDGSVVVYWFLTPPVVDDDGKIDWAGGESRTDTLGPPRAYRVSADQYEVIPVDSCPPIHEYDVAIIDCIIRDRNDLTDKAGGISFCRGHVAPFLARNPSQRVVLLTQRKDTVELPYSPRVVIAWKDDTQPLQELIGHVVGKTITSAKHGKVAVYDQPGLLDVAGLSEEARKSLELLDEPISAKEQLRFHRGYVEVDRELTKRRAQVLRRLASECSVPIAFSWTFGVESGVVTFGSPYFNPLRWFENLGLILVEPTTVHVTEWVERFAKCPVIVGGEEMAGVLRNVIANTRYLALQRKVTSYTSPYTVHFDALLA